MPPTPDAELATVARELYARAPGEFVSARNARAAQVRREGDRELATSIKALPKASVAAWAVGAVAREHPEELDALGELGAELRVAQASANPTELRALSRRRRELTGAATRTAVRLAEEHGVGLSGAAQEQVEATWSAVVIDSGAERALRSLLLVRALAPSGGLEDALAVPGAVEVVADEPVAPPRPRSVRAVRKERPAPAEEAPGPRAISRRPRAPEPAEESEEPARPSRRAISRTPRAQESPAERKDTAREVRRAERELRARERVAEHAGAELEDAAEELSRVEALVLQAAARTEELRRELEELEERLTELGEERTQAAEEREDAEAREEAARQAVAEARQHLEELRG